MRHSAFACWPGEMWAHVSQGSRPHWLSALQGLGMACAAGGHGEWGMAAVPPHHAALAEPCCGRTCFPWACAMLVGASTSPRSRSCSKCTQVLLPPALGCSEVPCCCVTSSGALRMPDSPTAATPQCAGVSPPTMDQLHSAVHLH
jgi:hypothetical protein